MRKKGKKGKKGGLEAAASKRLAKIGEVKVKRPSSMATDAVTPDADPLLERTARLTKWIREHRQTFGGVVVVGLLGLGGFLGYTYWQTKHEADASAILAQAFADEHGHVSDKADDEDDEARSRELYPTFKTAGARRDAALAKYREVETKFAGTGAAILARLAEAGLLLDAGDAKGAKAAYGEVKDSPLAQADAEVRGRAIEGIGFADEVLAQSDAANKDKHLDDALAAFKLLEQVGPEGLQGARSVPPGARAPGQGRQGQGHRAAEGRPEARRGARERPPVLVPGVRRGGPAARAGSVGAAPQAQAGHGRRRPGRRRGRGRRHERSADPGAAPAAPAARAAAGRRRAAPDAGTAGRTEVTGRRAARAAVVLAGAVSALGCATLETSDDHVNPEKPLWYQRPSGAIHVLFRARADGSAAHRRANPTSEDARRSTRTTGACSSGTSDHGLYALRAGNGSTIWRFETLGSVQSEPLYDAELDVVYFGSNDGALYAVHAADGALVWRYDSGGEITRRPVLGGEMLYFANGADNLFAVDRRSGKALWRVHRTSALGMEVSGYAGPALDQGMVFFAFSDGHVGAYDARDGTERWTPVDLSAEAEQAQGGEALRYLDVDTTPVPDDLGAAGRVVFVASYAGGVYALDEERGAPLWKNDKAVGVTDLALWREPAHTPAPGEPQYVPGGPPVPPRRDPVRLQRDERSLGARSGDGPEALAGAGPGGRHHGPGAAGRRAPGRDDAVRRVPPVAAERAPARRDRPRLGLLADARGLRQPGLRAHERRHAPRAAGRAAHRAGRALACPIPGKGGGSSRGTRSR